MRPSGSIKYREALLAANVAHGVTVLLQLLNEIITIYCSQTTGSYAPYSIATSNVYNVAHSVMPSSSY